MRKLVLLICCLACSPLVTACSSDTAESDPMSDNLEGGHKLGEFEAFTEAVEQLTDNHVIAVKAASSLEEVGRLEAEYAETADFLLTELVTIQGELEHCEMAEGMADHMAGTRSAVDAMMAQMQAHGATQAGNTDLAQCVTEESAHETAMAADLASCLEHHDAMHDGVTCMGGHMM